MTWRGERRKQLPPDWAARRRARLELDGYRCTQLLLVDSNIETADIEVRCSERATDVHHAGQPDDHRIESLRSLCAHHHQLETQAEAAQAQGRGPTRFRPKKKHPGLR